MRAMPALIKPSTLLILASLTISLIEDQVLKMNSESKAPSVITHGGCSCECRKSVFLEASQKRIKVMLVTAERFVLPSFYPFLRNAHEKLEIILQFVIDEGHCLSKEHVNAGSRNCYGEISGVCKDHFNECTIVIASATIEN